MKNKIIYLIFSVFLILTQTISCTKDKEYDDYVKTSAAKDAETREAIAGTWNQKDIRFAVDIPKDALGMALPAGTSLFDVAPLMGLLDPSLAPIGEAIMATKNNTYTFNEDGTFTVDGNAELLFGGIGNSGNWEVTIYNHVLQLSNEEGEIDPHWIERLADKRLDLALTLEVAGTEAPFLILLTR